MKKVCLLILVTLLVLVLVSCTQSVSGGVVQSNKQRDTSPDVSEADITSLVEGNSTFAFTLYQELKGKEGNLFYSPYSISAALAMTYAGARGETEQQMADTLHYLLSQDSLHPAFNSLDLQLAQRGEGAAGKDEQGFRLNIVNAIWGQKDYKFLSGYLDILATNYGAGLRVLDFIGAPEDSRITINEWVSDQTEGRIKDLLQKGIIKVTTRLVLTNAIYFNAAWEYPFQEGMTKDGIFYLLDGSEITVPMMRQLARFGYAEGEGYQAVELPYDGNELSMIILLPRQGRFKAFQESLDVRQYEDIVGSIKYEKGGEIALTMPHFEFESSFKLKESLGAMGMPVAFSESADFSGMTGRPELAIDDVIHKAFVAVDESGTEAAAATAVVMNRITSSPGVLATVTVDRPFIFLIRDIETGTILFVGRVVDPQS